MEVSLGDKSSGPSVMIAQNGEGCLLIFFFPQRGHVQIIFGIQEDLKKPKIVGSPQLALECEPSGLDALASAAVLGDKKGDVGESSIGATTKHPRHCLGCTCIVCIQPPSGKGKHKTTCTCNVCMTVKRRFKPLMLRKKKRQSEHEAEILQKDNEHKDESELKETRPDHSEKEARQSRIQDEVAETSSGQIDLNCHPHVKICNLKNQD